MPTQPFQVFRDVIVVTAGRSSEWVVCNVTEVDNKEYVKICPSDRKLARALGLDMEQRWPWGGKPILKELINIRDNKIEQLMKAAVVMGDERADADGGADQSVRNSHQRAAAFESLPKSIPIICPGFSMPGGALQAEHRMWVLSTPATKGLLHIELACRQPRLSLQRSAFLQPTH